MTILPPRCLRHVWGDGHAGVLRRLDVDVQDAVDHLVGGVGRRARRHAVTDVVGAPLDSGLVLLLVGEHHRAAAGVADGDVDAAERLATSSTTLNVAARLVRSASSPIARTPSASHSAITVGARIACFSNS